MNDPVAYLPFINAKREKPLTPETLCECVSCPTVFPIKEGFAVQALCKGERVMALFCTDLCYLRHMPIECCGHA